MRFCWAILALALVHPLVLADTPAVTFEASDGTLYSISPGRSSGTRECGPIPGGFECTVDSRRVVSVLDGLGCRNVRGSATCGIVDDRSPYRPAGKSILECENKNYELTDGADGQCTGNNGKEMTCEQINSGNSASASCDDGCGLVSGDGECRPVAKPRGDE